jgi:hypothetical protein
MGSRRWFGQSLPLEERLAEEAKSVCEQAKTLPPGPKREAVLRRARLAEIGAHITEWLTSPGLQSPK